MRLKTVSVLFLAFVFNQLAWSQSNDECQHSYFGYRSDGIIFSLRQLNEEIRLRPDIRSEETHSYPYQFKTFLLGNKYGPVGLRPLFSFGPTSNDMYFTRTGDRAFVDVSTRPNGTLEVLSIDLINGDSQTLNPAGELRLQHGRIGTSFSPNRVGNRWIFNLRHGLNTPQHTREALSVLIEVEEPGLAGATVEQPFTTRGFVDLNDDNDIELQLASTDLRSSYGYLEGSEFAGTWPASDTSGVFQIREDKFWPNGAIAVELTYWMDAPRVNGRVPYEVTQYIYPDESGLKYQHAKGSQYRSFQYDGAYKEFVWLEKIIDAQTGATAFESSDLLLEKMLNDYKSEGWGFFAVHERDAASREYIIRLSAHPVHEVWELKHDEFGRRTEENLLCASGRD